MKYNSSSSSRMCTSRSSSEEQQSHHHRQGGGGVAGAAPGGRGEGSGEAAEDFDLEAQLPERRVLLHAQQQQEQQTYDYYYRHCGYSKGTHRQQEEWGRRQDEASQQQQQEYEKDEGQWKVQARGGSSRSRSGSSHWWEIRCSHSSSIPCTQVERRPSTPCSSSSSSSSSSGRRRSSSSSSSMASSIRRGRGRRFSVHNTRLSGMLPSSTHSADGSSRLCCCEGCEQQQQQQERGEEGKGSSTSSINDDDAGGEAVEKDKEEGHDEQGQQCQYKQTQVTQGQQRREKDRCPYSCQQNMFAAAIQGWDINNNRQQQQQEERSSGSSLKHQMPLQDEREGASEKKKEEEARGDGTHTSSSSSHGVQRHPHKRHSVDNTQLPQVNGHEGYALRGRKSSNSSSCGAGEEGKEEEEAGHPAVKKEGKMKKNEDEEDEMGRKSIRRLEKKKQQQQHSETGPSGVYGFHRSTSSHNTSAAVMYQWKRRVPPDSALMGRALLQQQQPPVHAGEKNNQQQVEQQQEQQVGQQQETGNSKEEEGEGMSALEEDDVVQSEAETYDVLCGVRNQKAGAVNGYVTSQDFFFSFQEGEEGDERQRMQGEDKVGKDQQKLLLQQQRQVHQQQQRKQHLQQHQQKQHKQQLKQQQKQQQKQKQQQQKQKQKQKHQVATLSRSTFSTAFEEGQLHTHEKQQHPCEPLIKDGLPAAEPPFCLFGDASLHAEEAVCAWLFDILLAHLEGSRGQPMPPDSIRRMHREHVHCPAFVTWMKKKKESSSFDRVDVELRGCIGSLTPIPVLEIGEYALTSALKDRRFRPIALREVPQLACYVSLLHSYEDAKHPFDWEIGVHGITIKFFGFDEQTYTATYLPEVAKELGMTHREALTSLVRKSGYSGALPDNFLSRLSVTRYRSSQARLDYDTYLRRYGRYACAQSWQSTTP